MEIYTFSDFCEDREILTHEGTDGLRHLKAMWSIYADDYINYCNAQGYEHERLP